MCLRTYQKEPEILEEDLIVYKQLECINDDLVSPYQRNEIILDDPIYFKWTLNVLYQTKIEQTMDKQFADWTSQKHYTNFWDDESLLSYGPGFHSYNSKDRIKKLHGDFITFECLIPKGSEVYRDETGLLVSNQLIVLKEI